MKKLLVTGVSGFPGWNICRRLKQNWDITGIFFSHPISISGVKCVQADLTDYQTTKDLFAMIRPDVVIHTAAISNIN
ncbi:MAG: NAD-dependent epimerase/dehydratase family protein [Desulfoferrobacter sp.]